jgi:hypothetical protein
MTEPMFLYGIFANRESFAYPGRRPRLRGHYPVIVDRIPPGAPQDWKLGPKQPAGDWGAYSCCGMTDWTFGARNHHGPYAYVTARTLAEIEVAAMNPFEFQVGPWSRCNNLRALEATMRYRGYEGFDDSLLP